MVNVRNKEAECFKCAVLSAVHHDEVEPKSMDKVAQYQHRKNELDVAGLEFPMEVDKIVVFEKLNPYYTVIVFSWQVKEIYNMGISKFSAETLHLDQDHEQTVVETNQRSQRRSENLLPVHATLR